jgi:hypothetical protein
MTGIYGGDWPEFRAADGECNCDNCTYGAPTDAPLDMPSLRELRAYAESLGVVEVRHVTG